MSVGVGSVGGAGDGVWCSLAFSVYNVLGGGVWSRRFLAYSDPQHSTHQRRFQFIREIAHGGFGTVFLVRLLQPDGFTSVVAVKLLHPEWCENDEVSGRMRDEARLLGLLHHRNIVRVIDLTRIDGRVAVVMEYVEAVDLKALTATLGERGDRVPPAVALQIVAQAAAALDAAYNRAPIEGDRPLRVVHRDIKPSNLMIDADGVVKVLDFGVARADFAEREAETRGMTFGSYDYMPPERRFMEPGGETSDVYSLGAILYELLDGSLLGKAPLDQGRQERWADTKVQELRRNLSVRGARVDEICTFIRSMIAYDAEGRPRPSQVDTTFRRLARSLGGPHADDWAAGIVPSMLRESRASEGKHTKHPLVGRTIVEDRHLAVDGDWRATPIPKRVRDAAPARPPLAGTVTPAPLRKRPPDRDSVAPAPPRSHAAAGTVPGWATERGAPVRAARPPERRSVMAQIALAMLWTTALIVSLAGLLAVGLALVARLAS